MDKDEEMIGAIFMQLMIDIKSKFGEDMNVTLTVSNTPAGRKMFCMSNSDRNGIIFAAQSLLTGIMDCTCGQCDIDEPPKESKKDSHLKIVE